MAVKGNKLDISKIITPQLINLKLKGHTKKEAITEMTEMLLKSGDVVDGPAFIDDVLFRETEGMTGLGQGIAIPHGKSKAVKNTALAVGISDHPIAWESLDDEPINIIILFAVRDVDANTLHIKLLQSVAILLADDDFIAALHQVKDKQSLMKLLKKEQGKEE